MKRNRPIIPYYGGKFRTARSLARLIRSGLSEDGTYYEPFVGGAAVLIELSPKRAVIGDVVPDLINLYECVRDDPQRVVDGYNRMKNRESTYYKIRNFDRSPHFKSRNRFFKASRYMYLCKMGFGTCRFNSIGLANQGYFRRPERPMYAHEDYVLHLHKILQNTEIHLGDYRETIKGAKPGDVVYLDPPYIETRYDQYWLDKFERKDVDELRDVVGRLDDDGVGFVMSHSNHEYVASLFADFRKVSLTTFRDIKFDERDSNRFDSELIITNIGDLERLEDGPLVKFDREER